MLDVDNNLLEIIFYFNHYLNHQTNENVTFVKYF